MIDFFVPCIPPKVSHHAKKIVRRGKFHSLADKPELVNAREALVGLFRPHTPSIPMTGPLSLTMSFTWPWRKGDSKKLRAKGQVPLDTKPDLDNLMKTSVDCMAICAYFINDSQIVAVSLAKYLGEKPGIGVTLMRYE